MTIIVSDGEWANIEELCSQKDISKTALVKQALRLYAIINDRTKIGDKVYFEDSASKRSEIVIL